MIDQKYHTPIIYLLSAAVLLLIIGYIYLSSKIDKKISGLMDAHIKYATCIDNALSNSSVSKCLPERCLKI